MLFQINAKYSDELAQESLEWVKSITDEDFSVTGDMDNFYEVLKDGQVLCKYVNLFAPKNSKINSFLKKHFTFL